MNDVILVWGFKPQLKRCEGLGLYAINTTLFYELSLYSHLPQYYNTATHVEYGASLC